MKEIANKIKELDSNRDLQYKSYWILTNFSYENIVSLSLNEISDLQPTHRLSFGKHSVSSTNRYRTKFERITNEYNKNIHVLL